MKYIIVCFAIVLFGLITTPFSFSQNSNLKEDKVLEIGKKSNHLSLGFYGGGAFVKGEVQTQGGVGLGLGLTKAVNRCLSFRLHSHASSTKGMNHYSSTDYAESGPNPWQELYFVDRINQLDNSINPPEVFYNYSMKSASLVLQAIFNLNDLNFATSKKNWNIYGALGGGIRGYSTKLDAARAFGSMLEPYDFVGISYIGQVIRISQDRKDVINDLKGIVDGIYESSAEIPPESTTIQVKGNTYVLNPMLNLSAGFQYRLKPKVSLVVEYSIFLSSDDMLDGVKVEGTRKNFSALIQDHDRYTFASLGFDFNL